MARSARPSASTGSTTPTLATCSPRPPAAPSPSSTGSEVPAMRSRILLFVSLLALTGCVTRRELPGTPTEAFERLVLDYDQYYGLFEVKQIDWAALHETHSPRVHDAMSDAELYEVIVELLATLNDKHVTLYPATNPELPNFSVDLVDGAFPAPPFDLDV